MADNVALKSPAEEPGFRVGDWVEVTGVDGTRYVGQIAGVVGTARDVTWLDGTTTRWGASLLRPWQPQPGEMCEGWLDCYDRNEKNKSTGAFVRFDEYDEAELRNPASKTGFRYAARSSLRPLATPAASEETYGTQPDPLPETLPDGTESYGWRLFGIELRGAHYHFDRSVDSKTGTEIHHSTDKRWAVHSSAIDWTTAKRPPPQPVPARCGDVERFSRGVCLRERGHDGNHSTADYQWGPAAYDAPKWRCRECGEHRDTAGSIAQDESGFVCGPCAVKPQPGQSHPAAKPDQLYVPTYGERVRVVEVCKKDPQPGATVGEILVVTRAQPSNGAHYGGPGWVIIYAESKVSGTVCRVEPVPAAHGIPVNGPAICGDCGKPIENMLEACSRVRWNEKTQRREPVPGVFHGDGMCPPPQPVPAAVHDACQDCVEQRLCGGPSQCRRCSADEQPAQSHPSAWGIPRAKEAAKRAPTTCNEPGCNCPYCRHRPFSPKLGALDPRYNGGRGPAYSTLDESISQSRRERDEAEVGQGWEAWETASWDGVG